MKKIEKKEKSGFHGYFSFSRGKKTLLVFGVMGCGEGSVVEFCVFVVCCILEIQFF